MPKVKAGMPAILIDTHAEELCFFHADDVGGVAAERETLAAPAFSEEFFERLSHILGFRRDAMLAAGGRRGGIDEITLLLPDELFVTDSVSIPLVKRNLINSSLLLAIRELYKNDEELKFSSYQIATSKQNMTYGLLGIRRETVTRTVEAFREQGFSVAAILPQSHAAVGGALALCPALRGGTFALLDVEEGRSLLSLVLGGRCLATYSLPFGASALSDDAVNGEECLVDHAAAAALVKRAKAAARSRRILPEPEVTEGEAAPTEEEDEGITVMPETAGAAFTVRRSSRRLPAFMLRPLPDTREGVIYENFRHFMKWALEVVRANTRHMAGAVIDTVYVQMSSEYGFVYDMANSEGDASVKFAPLPTDKAPLRLDAYGALMGRAYVKPNNF